MRTCKRIFALLLAVSLVLIFVSCGSFDRIRKNFTSSGYIRVERAIGDDAEKVNTIVAELEKGNLSCTFHAFKKESTVVLGTTTYRYAFILEFKAEEDLEKAFEENGSPTLRTLFHDLQSTQYINGNCLLLPDAIDLLDNERVELFNK